MSGGKWSPVPRAEPEYLARWEQLNGKWRLVVTDRYWNNRDSVTTEKAVCYPPPGDDVLAVLHFVPAEGSEWEPDGETWQRPVCPAYHRHAR